MIFTNKSLLDMARFRFSKSRRSRCYQHDACLVLWYRIGHLSSVVSDTVTTD